ncbi:MULTISPECIES: recombinase family protein [unclassified Brevundimonas]|jgi:DNA invertase Pin-like site-specific DNA recombinase|uniref:recombinase family protein n=1 Tax=unclassified Brevundimonas TaxID=2622653 RepID=UPI000C3CC90A|nr:MULTISPECIES: recombinase family protein [unclassified Brevundimonas]MAL87535.1 resolvase [Brevundimonas sp.]HAV49732.1 resolvase [Brevundimonas sp.]|tara:strand:+ start:21624 stop:22166 length:543 start_codon:yes stop_codon:yes gene_type:complete
MAIIGYARVSSAGQSLEVQLEKLKAAGAEEIFAEKRSGTSTDGREELTAALRFARRGDVLIVTRMDRLARSVADLAAIVADLTKREIGFKVLDQATVDTTTANGRLMLNMLAAFAEFETDLRKDRQREGIEKAKAKGVYKGRPAKLPAHRVAELKAQGMGATEIAKKLGMGRASVYRLLS